MVPFPELTPFELTRAYTTLDRSGVVTDTIRACEGAWGTEFSGNVGALDAVMKAPGYREYVQALRASLPFPLTLYRVMSAEALRFWRETTYSKPVSATLCLASAHLIKDVFPDNTTELFQIKGTVTDPEAVLMRGRIDRYELVVDSGRVQPVQITIIDQGPQP
jgi:hypothetical protein